jgi:hypothetical protein
MTLLTTLVAALLGLLAAFAAAWISRSVKISEFRQKWIDELRSDIAATSGRRNSGIASGMNSIFSLQKRKKNVNEKKRFRLPMRRW